MTVTALASLDDIKTRLNILPDDADSDANLMDYLASATSILRDLYGDVIPTSYTEVLFPYGDGSRLLLGRAPLISVDSILATWPYVGSPNVVLSPNTYIVDLRSGVVTIFALSPAFSWQYAARDWSYARYTVAYTTGRAVVDPKVKDAVLELLRINWRPQAGGNLPGISSGDEAEAAGFTYLGFYIPNGVHERINAGARPNQIA